jgi:nucleotide-binding universal stress UspA family protein|tara:strand:- start:10 stop:594 length:585 start_codon:yes stop_codon:yes gene_type:complete
MFCVIYCHLSKTVFGSCADYSMRKVRCSTLIVKTTIAERGASGMKPRVFVVAVDGSESAHGAFLNTVQLCDRGRDVVNVVHFYDGRSRVADDPLTKDPDELAEYYTSLLVQQSKVVRGTVVVVEKKIGMSYAECICAFAWDNDCDVLSVGTDGMGAFLTNATSGEGNVFGSTSDYCVKNAKCNVLVCKKKGAVY